MKTLGFLTARATTLVLISVFLVNCDMEPDEAGGGLRNTRLGDSLDRTRRHLESSKMRHFFLDIKENSPAAAESAKGSGQKDDKNDNDFYSSQRKRRNEGMAFYRPTKHNSLFFISSNKSKKFQATKLDEGKDGEEVTRLEEADHLIQTVVANLSTVDKSDLLTVRSLPEAEEPQPEQPLPRPAPAPASAYEDLVFSLASATDTKLESEEVGGISHIPGLSEEEEAKLLLLDSALDLDSSYQSDDFSASTRTEPTTTLQNNKYQAVKFDEDEIKELQMDEEFEAAEAGEAEEANETPAATSGSDSKPSKQGYKNICHDKERKMTQKETAYCFLAEVENQARSGANCTPGTDLDMGEQVVNRYAQERFQDAAMISVNMANWFTRMWKYAPEVVGQSEYLLHSVLIFGTELSDDIFAFGNCYDEKQYKNYTLFCPYAYRQPDGEILAKDLAIEYKYLSNTSEWFYNARKKAESVSQMGRPLKIGWHTYTHNSTAHTDRSPDKILTVRYEDGAWTKPYYDCGGGNIWMMTYTVPFFGFENGQYVFKGTSGIDIDLRRVDIDQCPSEGVSEGLNIFRGTDKCKKKTTFCEAVSGLGFRRGSYKCVCKIGYYFPNTTSEHRFFNGTDVEDEAAKLEEGEESYFDEETAFQCLLCAAGCESCVDSSPCIVTLNWVLRTILLILQCVIIGCLPVVVLFTYKYKEIKVVRAASPVLLRIIILGAFFIYSTTIILYPTPNIVTCTMRIWLREIGFALAYGALMLKTWRISVIFRVKSAKAVKITDMDLIKRLGLIVGVFILFLLIRTLVSPPVVYTGTTSENLKAFLCSSDWWDHSFTILEFLFLLWGIRLCIMVRKAPSEFNESRFISMTIYNEFLLSIFLNVSVFFLQKPANPDLLYIIFFCHSQLTISILLCLIFASKFYLVMKGHGKQQEEQTSLTNKSGQGKFVTSKARVPQNSCVSQVSAIPQSQIQPPPPQPPAPQPPPVAAAVKQNNPTVTGATTVEVTPQPPLPPGGLIGGLKAVSDQDIEQELDRILAQLQLLSKSQQEKGLLKEGLTLKITAVQEALKAASAVPPASAGNGLKSNSSTNGGSNAGSNGGLVGSKAVAALTNSGSAVKSVEAVEKEAACTAASAPAASAPVQELNNGQVVHCRASPLQPVQPPLHLPAGLPPSSGLPTCCPTSLNKSPSNCDSPVIVHQYSERPSRVSFDLAQEDGSGLGLPVDLHDPTDPCAADSTAVEVFLEPPGGSNSDMSGSGSCHSSRCCCSSYVCSVCSPRGSIDNVAVLHDSASSANSIDIACPRMVQTCKQPLQPLQPLQLEEGCNYADNQDLRSILQLEVSSKNTQTDMQNIQQIPPLTSTEAVSGSIGTGHTHPATFCHQQNGKTESRKSTTASGTTASETASTAASAETAVAAIATTASPTPQQPRNSNKPPKTHRILINLDDKNRFTEEVTV